MAEEEKPKQLVQTSTVIASGIAAIVVALFTSRLGVAGTLIGTAMTPMLMTIGVAILNAQIEKATTKISELQNTVQSHLSTQRIRVPGTPIPEETSEKPEPPVAPRRRDRRTSGVFGRLLSIPTFLKEMSPSARRRTLLTGAAAGIIAAVIGLGGVTGIEAASGNPLYCTLWNKCAQASVPGEETAGASTSLTRALGGSGNTETQNVPAGSEGLPAEDQQQEEAQPTPDSQEEPVGEQYEGAPQGGGQAPPVEPQEGPPVEPAPQEEQPAAGEPGAVPQDGSQVPPADPAAEQEAPATPLEEQPVAPSEQPVAPPEQPVAPPEQQQ
ncbi:MAG: hypothetical protein M3P37_13555 [Actinomycetota bacterium]|nr:hypothetical protein [Actinomycetota bacterium]